MKQIFKLAWRNIWRKRNRSLIAILSVTFAVFLAVNFRSLQWGSYDKIIEAGVKNSGYIQVHAANYWEDRSINDLLEDSEALKDSILQVKGVKTIIPRLQNYGLAASDHNSKGAVVIGIALETEDSFNKIAEKVISGSYLKDRSKGVLIAEGLARYLQLELMDTLVLFGQGHHGSIAAGKYPVQGIMKLPNPQMDKMTVYMPLDLAQEYNGAYGKVSAYMLDMENPDQIAVIMGELKKKHAHLEIMSWDEMQPGIRDSIKTDTSIATMLLTCLYLIVGFGVIGTIIMMALERKREFGMLQAIGLQKKQVQLLLVVESFIFGLVGVLLAFCIAAPLVWYMNTHPIPLTGESARSFEAMGAEPVIQFAIEPSVFLIQGSVVFGIMMLASLFPALMVKRMKINEVIK